MRIRVITALSVSAAKNGTRRVGMYGGKIECYRIERYVATTSAEEKTKKDGEDLQVREKEGGGETTMIHRVFLSDLGEMRCRTTNTAWS